MGAATKDLFVKQFVPSTNLKTVSVGMIALGVVTFLVGLFQSPERAWTAYLTAFFFVSCLGLGGLFIAVIQHIAKAGWSVGIRRIAEGMTSFLPLMFLGCVILIFGMHHLYIWLDPEYVANSYLVSKKTAYLNLPFFVIRMFVFAVGMLIFSWLIVGNSIRQDQTGDQNLTVRNVGLGIAFLLFFALSFSLFSVDLLMTLLPTWFSTIYGVYTFSGMAQSSFAFLILLLIFFKRTGFVGGYYTTDHIHDAAKFLKGFTVFWAYIAFSQYLLIWYANIPDETEFFLMRMQNGWMEASFALLIFKFIVPFLALLPREFKRNENHLIAVCILVLVMQYFDIHWQVYPNFNENKFVFGFYEIGLLVGFLGLFLMSMIRFFSTHSLVPLKDPRMHESLNHHVTY